MNGSSLLRGRRPLPLSLVAGLIVVGAMILGWRAGNAPGPRALAPPAAWAAPRPDPPDTGRDLAALTARKPWGGSAAFRDPELASVPAPQQTEPWRLVGIVERDREPLAMILVGVSATARLEYRALGERLPDGSVLVQIGADSATSQEGWSSPGGKRVYRLFENKQ